MEESVKIEPFIADAEGFLYIRESKGNRERMILIVIDEQCAWVDEAERLTQSKSNSPLKS